MKNYKVDRTFFDEGPWDKEPEDEINFMYKGYKCYMLRHPSFGIWRGYVYVPLLHKILEEIGEEQDFGITVHGGVTHVGHSTGHIVIGFDCMHYRDAQPYNISRALTETAKLLDIQSEAIADFISLSGINYVKKTYKDIKFVKKEIRSMVNQIIKKEAELQSIEIINKIATI